MQSVLPQVYNITVYGQLCEVNPHKELHCKEVGVLPKQCVEVTGPNLNNFGICFDFTCFLITYFQRLGIELNIATTKIINVVFNATERCFLFLFSFLSMNRSYPLNGTFTV